MYASPLPDFGWGVLVLMGSLYGLAILVPLSVLLEALVYMNFLRREPWTAIGVSLLVNLISGVIGIFVINIVGRAIIGRVSGGTSYYDSGGISSVALQVLWFVLWMVTVVIEGGLLRWIAPKFSADRIWGVALLANLVSYMPLILLYLGMSY